MDISDRVITRLPLNELWHETGCSTYSRRKSLSLDEIAALLRIGPLQFVVADVGAKPLWIDLSKCYEFWKREVKSHVCDTGSVAVLGRYPDAYCYFASEWSNPEGSTPIVVLEKQH